MPTHRDLPYRPSRHDRPPTGHSHAYLWTVIVALAVGLGVSLYSNEDSPVRSLVAGAVTEQRDCAPMRLSGRPLTDAEWDLVIDFTSDQYQQFSKSGMTLNGESWSWCELLNDPELSPAYWYFVQGADAYLATMEFLCDMGLDDTSC